MEQLTYKCCLCGLQNQQMFRKFESEGNGLYIVRLPENILCSNWGCRHKFCMKRCYYSSSEYESRRRYNGIYWSRREKKVNKNLEDEFFNLWLLFFYFSFCQVCVYFFFSLYLLYRNIHKYILPKPRCSVHGNKSMHFVEVGPGMWTKKVQQKVYNATLYIIQTNSPKKKTQIPSFSI